MSQFLGPCKSNQTIQACFKTYGVQCRGSRYAPQNTFTAQLLLEPRQRWRKEEMEEELTDMRKTVWEVFPIPFCKKKNQKTMSKTWNSSSAEMRNCHPMHGAHGLSSFQPVWPFCFKVFFSFCFSRQSTDRTLVCNIKNSSPRRGGWTTVFNLYLPSAPQTLSRVFAHYSSADDLD